MLLLVSRTILLANAGRSKVRYLLGRDLMLLVTLLLVKD